VPLFDRGRWRRVSEPREAARNRRLRAVHGSPAEQATIDRGRAEDRRVPKPDRVLAPHRVCQQARNLVWSLSDAGRPVRFLIHDRDSKFTDAFDSVFETEGIEIIRTPIWAPRANAIAERFVGTTRRECLDWILVFGQRQLQRVLDTYVEHYNGHRPHRALGLAPPEGRGVVRLPTGPQRNCAQRRDRLGRLIHEYSQAA